MTKTDEDAIREIELRFNAGWGRHDPDAMVESLLDDAQFVTVNGAWTKTRDGLRDLARLWVFGVDVDQHDDNLRAAP